MKISAAIREYLIEIEVRKYTPKTIRGYRNSLNLFLRFCEQEAHIQEVEETNLAVVRQFGALSVIISTACDASDRMLQQQGGATDG